MGHPPDPAFFIPPLSPLMKIFAPSPLPTFPLFQLHFSLRLLHPFRRGREKGGEIPEFPAKKRNKKKAISEVKSPKINLLRKKRIYEFPLYFSFFVSKFNLISGGKINSPQKQSWNDCKQRNLFLTPPFRILQKPEHRLTAIPPTHSPPQISLISPSPHSKAQNMQKRSRRRFQDQQAAKLEQKGGQ